ncbi:MAG TPA: cytochrome c biogenesis protein CcdA [Methylocystis sp.]|nr:cytochrome c biogenesis protein CcdA [Methylocystis sp.]
MNAGAIGLALLAGLLSVLSPCVAPLLPLVLAAAAARSRFGPALLALGVSFSFVAIGLFVATIGFSIGLDDGVFRRIGAILMIAFGIVLLLPPLQARVAAAAGPLSDRLDRLFRGAPVVATLGPFGLGLALGAVWSPCVGPTLGAASLLAARGQNLGEVALTMGAFGIGAAAPLLLLGLLSREVFARWRVGLLAGGTFLKQAMGALLLLLGGIVLFGLDKNLEAALVDASPEWLTSLTTRF